MPPLARPRGWRCSRSGSQHLPRRHCRSPSASYKEASPPSPSSQPTLASSPPPVTNSHQPVLTRIVTSPSSQSTIASPPPAFTIGMLSLSLPSPPIREYTAAAACHHWPVLTIAVTVMAPFGMCVPPTHTHPTRHPSIWSSVAKKVAVSHPSRQHCRDGHARRCHSRDEGPDSVQ